MGWKKIVYFPNPIKTHFVHDSILNDVLNDIRDRHCYEPEKIEDVDDIRIDPGGIMNLNSEPLVFPLDDANISIRPEHIWGANSIWGSYNRIFSGKETGQIRKVYCAYMCMCVSEKHYQAIGAWLASLGSLGIEARREIADALKEVPEIHVVVPEEKGVGEA